MHRVTPELSVDSVGVAAIFRVQQSLKRGEVGAGVVLLLAVILEGSTGDVAADSAQRTAGGLGEQLHLAGALQVVEILEGPRDVGTDNPDPVVGTESHPLRAAKLGTTSCRATACQKVSIT